MNEILKRNQVLEKKLIKRRLYHTNSGRNTKSEMGIRTKFIMTIAVCIGIISVLYIIFFPGKANAASQYEISYRAIEIQAGDTLTSLGEQYKGQLSREECIKLMKKVNNIINQDKIGAGNYLLIPVCVDKTSVSN